MGGDQRSRHVEAHGGMILALYEAERDITAPGTPGGAR